MRSDLDKLGTATDAWRAQFLDPTVALIQAGQMDQARSIQNLDTGEAAFTIVTAADTAFDKGVESLSAATVTNLARIENGQAWLMQVNIASYQQGNRNNPEPERRRRLLLHKREIEYLDGRVRTQGLTIIPMKLYLVRNRVKVEIGLARGKKLWDKRQDVAKRDAERDMERAIRR